MSIKQVKVFAFVMLLALSLTSCKVSTTCEFQNISGLPIEVSVLGKDGRKLGVIEHGESVAINDWGWHTLNIESALVTGKYDQPKPPNECIVYRGWGPWLQPTFRVGLLPDGNIHLDCSKSNAAFPITPNRV
jgi:hypothetical protein